MLQERETVSRALSTAGRVLIDLSQTETAEFGGNCLEVCDEAGDRRFLAVSARALAGLTPVNKKKVEEAFDALIVCHIPFIEYVGGGGIRCMLAGNYLSKK